MVRHLGCALALILTACTTVVPTPVYQPQSLSELDGAITVDSFTYSPDGDLAQDEIYFSMAGTWRLQQPVGAYVTNAVKMELRQAGVSLAGSRCHLSGDVRAVRLMIGTGVLSSEIAYVLEPGDATRFDKVIANRVENIRLGDTGDAAAFLNQAIGENIGALLGDASFQEIVAQNCRA